MFKTSYAGELNIQWSEINNLTSDEPQQVVLSDGSIVKGKIENRDAGEGKIVSEKVERDFDLNETRYINPSVDCNKRVNIRNNKSIANLSPIHILFPVLNGINADVFCVINRLSESRNL